MAKEITKSYHLLDHQEKTIYILDLLNEDLVIKVNINLNYQSKITLYLGSFTKSKRVVKININHLENDGYSKCSVYSIGKNKANIDIDLVSTVVKNKTDNTCIQDIKGLILCEEAIIKAKPSLIVNNNKINAKHSLSVGKILPSVYFYLMSRGLNRQEIIFLLIASYLTPFIDKLTLYDKEKYFAKIKELIYEK